MNEVEVVLLKSENLPYFYIDVWKERNLVGRCCKMNVVLPFGGEEGVIDTRLLLTETTTETIG